MMAETPISVDFWMILPLLAAKDLKDDQDINVARANFFNGPTSAKLQQLFKLLNIAVTPDQLNPDLFNDQKELFKCIKTIFGTTLLADEPEYPSGGCRYHGKVLTLTAHTLDKLS